jgi:hypothetical protein
MKSIIVKVIVGMALPVLLFAWGNDIVVDTMRRSNNEYPVTYDVIWPNDTNMIVAVGYDYQGSDSHVDLYQSQDAGQTWQMRQTIFYQVHNIKNIQLTYYDQTGYLLWLTTNGETWLVTFDLNSLSYINSLRIGPTTDSIVKAFISKAVTDNILTLYVATTSRSSDFDILKIYRSIDSGPFQTVDSVRYSHTMYYYDYKDLDVTLRSDTIKIYATLETLDTTTHDKNLIFWMFNDKPDRLFYYTGSKYVESDPSVSPHYPSLSVAPGGYLICLYEANGDIKYSFSNDYGNTLVTYDFPFDTPDSTESTPEVVWWSIPPYFRGFNTLFTRGTNLYFVDASCSSGGMSWGTPVLVSNEHPYSTYIFRDVETYLPRLANRYDMAVPAAIWARDFQHYMYPIFYYDSTYICVDNMSATGIRENNFAGQKLNFSINTISNGCVTLNFVLGAEEHFKGSIISPDGRIVRDFEITKGEKSYTIDTRALPAGIYFINLTGEKANGLKKFIITK